MMNLRFLMLAACCLTVLAAPAKKKQLLILYTNDTHSAVMPLHRNLSDTLIAGRGGFLRRMAVVGGERKAEPAMLLFDSGDFSQGSPYYSLYKGDVEVGLMNKMGYDAATIGNHEFDFGLENMARIFRLAEFPIVCANYDFEGTPVAGLVRPYVVLKRKGIRVGVFGIGPKLKGLVDETKCVGVGYSDPVRTARETVATLRNKERCDVVICLSHLGWDNMGLNDQLFLKQVEGIDLVLGGHSHTYMERMEHVTDAAGRAVPVDQNGKHGIFVGRIVMDFEK